MIKLCSTFSTVCSALLIAGWSQPALADEVAIGAAIPAPPDRSSDTFNPFTASLDVSTDDSELTLSIATKPVLIESNDGSRQTKIRRSFGLDFSLPVGGEDDLTDKATLNGLSNGASITGKFTLFGATAKDQFESETFLAMHDRAKRNCLESAEDDEQRKVCNQQPRRDFTVKWKGASEASVNRSLLSPAWSLVLQGSIGWNDFEYIQPITLNGLSDNKIQYSFGATGTLYPSDAMSSYSLGAEYQRSYKATDSTVVCKPVVINPSDDCKSGAPLAPTLDKSLLFKAEARYVIPLGSKLGELGIAPIGSVDALDGDWGVEFPIYWIPAVELPVLPGIKVGYSSEEDDFTFGFFLKTSFGF